MPAPASPAAPASQMSLRIWVMLFALGLLWGGSFFFSAIAVTEIPPLVLVLFRVVLAAAALHLYLAIRGPSFRLALPLAGSFLVLGLINNVIPFSLMFLGQTEIGAGLAAVLNATTPFWTVILANSLTQDEKFTKAKLAGILLGIFGTAVMIGPGLLTGLGGPAWAKLCLIGTALSYAFSALFARRFRALPPAIVATGQLTASSLIMIPVILLLFGPAALLVGSAPVWAAVLALAVISTAFAYILYFTIIASAGATNASLVTLLVPMSAILLGAIFLGERLEAFELAGMGLILVGLLVIDGRIFRRHR